MLAIRSLTSGFPVSALVASIAMLVIDPKVALSNLMSPVPGSAIVVELSKVYFHAIAPVAASAATWAASAAVSAAVADELEEDAADAELAAAVTLELTDDAEELAADALEDAADAEAATATA